MVKRLFTIFMLIMIVGCSQNNEQPSVEINNPINTDYEILVENLSIPWSVTKSNDRFFISERTGSIVVLENKKATRQTVTLKKSLSDAAEAGLLGFVLHPDFATNQQAFAYYTYEDSSGQFNRLVILQKNDNRWEEMSVLIDKIPSGRYHHGGRLAIGPDQKLYVTVGDATVPEKAQDISSLAGKILRINLDGSIPSDNPFENSYVYSYGHRNPQGLTWEDEGSMYASEHGQSAHDEVNKIQPGNNYGWPIIQGDETEKEMERPLFHTGEITWAPSGIAYYEGNLYVATLAGNAVKKIDLKTLKAETFISGLGRIRDVMVEGNTLYFITNNTDGRGTPGPNDDKLYKVILK